MVNHIGPELCLSAVKILCQVSQSQPVQTHMVGLLTADKVSSSHIPMHAKSCKQTKLVR